MKRFWRERVGIEPTSRLATTSAVLKTVRATRPVRSHIKESSYFTALFAYPVESRFWRSVSGSHSVTSQPFSLANLLQRGTPTHFFACDAEVGSPRSLIPALEASPVAISCGIASHSLILHCFLSPSVERSSASNCGRSFAGCPSSWLAQSRCGRCTRGRRACYSPGCTATALHRRGAA